MTTTGGTHETRIAQAPGWWPSLVRGVCDDCRWQGPVRDLNRTGNEARVRLDCRDHERGAA